MLLTLQMGARGTPACINADRTVSGIIENLDTTNVFTTGRTPNAEGDESFAHHRYLYVSTNISGLFERHFIGLQCWSSTCAAYVV